MVETVVLKIGMAIFVAGVSYQDRGDVPEVLRDANQTWIATWQRNTVRQLELLTAAYDLNVDMQDVVREELWMRWEQQAPFEEQQMRELDERLAEAKAAGGGNDSPENQKALDVLLDWYDSMPLNEERVADWLESQLPPEVGAKGRVRWEELRQRRDQRQLAEEDDLKRRSGLKTHATRTQKARRVKLSPRSNPMPPSEKAVPVLQAARRRAARRFLRPAQAVRGRPGSQKVDETRPEPAAGMGIAAVAPPLDEWDKQVARVAESHKMTEAQVTTARSILRGLRHRAYEYHRSRLAEYERVALIEERHVRQAQEEALNRPLDAMFEELKARLECLLTIEQQKQASAAE